MYLNRRLDSKEAATAITRLGLYTTKEAFDTLFSRLDIDGSGELEWEVCGYVDQIVSIW